jgi:hypothetical protein
MTTIREIFKKSKKKTQETTDKILDADLSKIKEDVSKSFKNFEDKKVPVYRAILIKIIIGVCIFCTIFFIIMVYYHFSKLFL